MKRLRVLWILLFIAGVIATLPYSIRWIAVSVLNYSLKDVKSHKAFIGSCSISLQGIAFQNVDIEWNENRFSSDEIEFKFPSVKGKGHFRIPVVFQHPQLFLFDESSCQSGLKASLAILLKLDPFVNHGVVEVSHGPFLAVESPDLEKKQLTHRYYFWSEYLSQEEKIFFFDRNPLPQGEPIASLLVRKIGAKEDHYELRIDNLDGEALLSLASKHLINKRWKDEKFGVQSAREGLISLRAQGTWSGEKLFNLSGEIEGINAFLFHPVGVIKAEEWSIKGSIGELPLGLGLSSLKAIDGQIELKGVKIHDHDRTHNLEKGEMSLALAHGLVSGTLSGSLEGSHEPYRATVRGTFDLLQMGVDAALSLEDAAGSLSHMEITADLGKGKEALLNAGSFPLELLLPTAASYLTDLAKGEKGNFISDQVAKMMAMPTHGKLSGYCQFSLQEGLVLKDAELELAELKVAGKEIALSCPGIELSYQSEPLIDLSVKTQNTNVEWHGEKIGEARFQLLQNPETKLTGFIDGTFKGQEMSLSWVGEKQSGIFSISSSDHFRGDESMPSNMSHLFSGLDIKGSWSKEKDRFSLDIEKLLTTGHAEVVVFDDGTGGFYFEKVPAGKFIALFSDRAGLRNGILQGSGEWNRDRLESSLEIEHLTCGHFFTSGEYTATSGFLRALSFTMPRGEVRCKVDFNEGGYALESEPFQIEVSHPLSLQKVFLLGSLKGNQDRIDLRDARLDSEWGSFQGDGSFLSHEEGKEIRLHFGGGELSYEKSSSSQEMQGFIKELFRSSIQFDTLSLAIPDNALELHLKKGLSDQGWQQSFLCLAHIDIPQIDCKGFAIEDFEGELVAKNDGISLNQGRCAFDIPGGRRVLCEEITALYSPEKKELFSRVDLGNLALMNLHLFLDTESGPKGKNWRLYSDKTTILGRPLEVFAIGSQSSIEKWSVATALDGALLKPFMSKIPFAEGHPFFSEAIPIELSSHLGNAERFEGKIKDVIVTGRLSPTYCEFALGKEDFHFDASWTIQNKIAVGKGSAITPDHKIGFSSEFNFEKIEGMLSVVGDSFTGAVGKQPIHLHYLLDVGVDSLSWKAELKEFHGKWNEFSMRLTEPALCKSVDQRIFCAGKIEAFKHSSLWAKGDFELKKNRISAALDVDLPKLHFCKNIDFLNPSKLKVETDIAKLSEIDITSSDVEVYLVDLKEKITLCNAEIALSMSKSPPIHLKSILKTSYNPFDFDVKIDPTEGKLPAEFSLNDKTTGEHLVGGFSFDSKGLVPQFFQGSFLGSYLEGKRNGDNFNVSVKAPLFNPVVNKAFPSLLSFLEKPFLAKTVLEVKGDVISHMSSRTGSKDKSEEREWAFLGNVEMKGFDLKNAPQGSLLSRVQYRNKELSLLDLQSSKMPFELKVKKALFHFGGEEVEMRIPGLTIKNFVPSELVSSTETVTEKPKSNWNLTHVSLLDLQGNVKEPKTWKGKGNAHFASVQKGLFSFAKNFKVALEQMGLSSSTLRPAVGDVDFMLDKGKVVLEDLKNSFSEGGATAFILSPSSRHFIYFDGSLNIELEPKPLQGLPWTQHVKVKIKGNLDQPEYQVR